MQIAPGLPSIAEEAALSDMAAPISDDATPFKSRPAVTFSGLAWVAAGLWNLVRKKDAC